MNVYRSAKYVYAQLIDDIKQVTLAAVHSKTIKVDGNKTEQAKEVGRQLAKLAAAQNISQIVFDRGGYIYHGRVAAVAEGAREAGLQF